MKHWIAISIFILLAINHTYCQQNTLTDQEKAEGWELLFDGVSTDQWRGYKRSEFPTKGWKVEDDALWVIFSGEEEEGFGGDIITKEKFESFILKVDFYLTDTANSGIFYRVLESDKAAIWHNAPEFQILDDKTYKTMNVLPSQMTASNYDMHPAENVSDLAVGVWHTAMIKVDGNHVEHWLNGEISVAYDFGTKDWKQRYRKSKFKSYKDYASANIGHIGLQDHGHTVKFRNIKILRL